MSGAGIDLGTAWIVIAALALGSYAIRLSFLALLGQRRLPDWFVRHLRFTAVAILPGLVAPLVLWPGSTGGTPDAARIAAALVTLAVGWATKVMLWAIAAGAATLYAGLWLGG